MRDYVAMHGEALAGGTSLAAGLGALDALLSARDYRDDARHHATADPDAWLRGALIAGGLMSEAAKGRTTAGRSLLVTGLCMTARDGLLIALRPNPGQAKYL